MSRRLTLLLIVCLTVATLVGLALWALPEVVRRVAVAKIPELTGRATRIEDVDLNLFTGRFAITKLWMARRPGHGPEAFVEFARLDGRLALLSLLRFDVRLVELRLARPIVRMTRTGPLDFDFSDLLSVFVKPVTKEEPSRWTFSLDRVEITDGAVLMNDAYLSRPEEWRVEGLGVEGSGLTTKRDQPAGRLRVQADLAGAPFRVASESVYLTPFNLSLDVSLSGFDLARVRRYLPADLPAVPETGKVGFALRLERVRAGEDLAKSSLSGEVRMDGLSVVQRDRTAPFLRIDRLAVAIKEMDFLASRVVLAAIETEGFDLKATRDKAGEIDLLTALRPSPATEPVAGGGGRAQETAEPSTKAGDSSPGSPRGPPSEAKLGTVRLERLTLRSGTVALTDEGVSPRREWRVEGVTVDGTGFSTSPTDPPGTLTLRAQIMARPGSTKPATFALDADSVRLVPASASARLSLEGFSFGAVEPYWPPTLPLVAPEGSVGIMLEVGVEQGGAGLNRAVASGSVRVEGLAVVQRGRPAPFLKIPRLAVRLKQVDALARSVALGTIDIEGADLHVVRDAAGQIDLLALAAPPPVIAQTVGEPAAPKPPAPSSAQAGQAWRLSLDRFALRKGTATFDDREVSPATSLSLTDLQVTAERLTWPPRSPATVTVSVTMPGGGRTEIKGGGTLEPLNIQIATGTREAPIEPYQAYFPFPARFLGFFSGDSLSEIQRGPDGTLILASRGTAWARDLEVRAPGAEEPAARLSRMEIRGIDFSWPNYALVDLVKITRPEVQVERDASGTINLRSLFEVRNAQGENAGKTDVGKPMGDGPAEAKPAGAEPGGSAAAPPPKQEGLLQTIVLDFNEILLEEGFIRFLDRTTKPAFSEDISKLALSIKGLSNVLGRQRTTMSMQAVVGGDAALDMRGELSGIAEALHADLVGELRDFTLASANPYADSLTSWIVQRGKLTAKVHYRIDGDHLIADHDVKFAGLKVARTRESDEAKRRLGLPLGLAVALLKDSHGNIDFDIPLTGTLGDRKFDWAESMWSAIKQVLVKVLVAPFSAIGRLFTGGDDKTEGLEVSPVTFEPGSSVIAPSVEVQLTRVADFLRRSPYVKLELTPVITAADVENLKAHEVLGRLQQFQKERGLADLAAALRAYYQQSVPGVTLPKTEEEQLALLREREPVPAAPLADLLKRRLDGVRDRLVKVEGIPAERLVPVEAPAPGKEATGEGRVEFNILSEAE